MTHYYKDGRRFTEEHQDWPKTKKGTPHQRPSLELIEQAGGVLGVTDTLHGIEDTGWMVDYGIRIGIEAGTHAFDSDSAMIKAKEIRDSAATTGSHFHDALEQYVFSGKVSDDAIIRLACENVEKALIEAGVDLSDVKTEHCITEYIKLADGKFAGYGGTVDLVTADAIVDYKTWEKPRKPYLKELLQLCAYAKGDFTNRLINVYVNRLTGEVDLVHEWTEAQRSEGWLFWLHWLLTKRMIRRMNREIKVAKKGKKVTK